MVESMCTCTCSFDSQCCRRNVKQGDFVWRCCTGWLPAHSKVIAAQSIKSGSSSYHAGPINMQIHNLFPGLDVTRERKVKFSSFGEASVVHKAEEDLLAGMPHFHGDGNDDGWVYSGQAGQGTDQCWAVAWWWSEILGFTCV